MSAAYTLIANLSAEAPAEGVLTRAVCNEEAVKAVLFRFAQDQELAEHKAPMPAVLHLLEGEVVLTLGKDVVEAKAGAWVYMTAGLPHGIRARTPAVLLLLVLKEHKG